MSEEKPSKQRAMDRTTVYLSPELRRRIRHFMADTDETMTKIIDQALTEYLDRNERERQ